MKWNNVDTIVFTDANGDSYSVKDIKPLETYGIGGTVQIQQNLDLDELVSRPEYFGKGNEGRTWELIEMNAEQLVDANFDLSKIKTLLMPILEES